MTVRTTSRSQKILFVGGLWPKFLSVGIRCIDIAKRLGCDYKVNVTSIDQIPSGYGVVVCVKVRLSAGEIAELSSRSAVLWDILDKEPPVGVGVRSYISSTDYVRTKYSQCGTVVKIPHHHCNFGSVMNDARLKKPGWLGHSHWYPTINVKHEVHMVNSMTQEEVVQAYRQIGIGLNLRVRNALTEQHVNMNSGIKLINCIGFGTPSISAMEPSYLEIGEGCTIFIEDQELAMGAVDRLINDEALFNKLRTNCCTEASRYHIDIIAAQYRKVIALV